MQLDWDREMTEHPLYDKLTPRQRKHFDHYVEHRSLNAMVTAFHSDIRAVKGVYNSKAFQLALKEHNEALKDKVMYTEAKVIDELWKRYNDFDSPPNVRVQILVLLGKHIGMWANTSQTAKEMNKSVTYNIVNYAEVKGEIDKNKEAVEEAKDKPELDIPDGVQITEYPDTVQ